MYFIRLSFYSGLIFISFFCCSQKQPTENFKNGDLIFQSSQSAQCKAVQLATHSIYSHCGIIYINDGKTLVYEAVQPVTITPLKEWIKRGKDDKYVVKRLKNSENLLTEVVLTKMRSVGKQYEGKDYDLFFEWTDDKIYCSELIWKIYKQGAGIEIGKLEKLKDFDLSSEPVKQKLKERYGKNIPYDEIVISPASIFNCNALYTVFEN